MQSSHTCHVNKTANFKTLTVLRQVTLRSGYCWIMFFSARRRERLGRGTGGRWMTCVTAGTATASRAGFFGVNTHSSSSLSDSVTDVWPRWRRLLVGGVDNKRGGGRHNVFAVYCTLRATSQWLSHVHIVKWPCCHPMQLGPPEVLDFVAAQHAVA